MIGWWMVESGMEVGIFVSYSEGGMMERRETKVEEGGVKGKGNARGREGKAKEDEREKDIDRY